MRIGIVIEGPNDHGTIPRLLHKVAPKAKIEKRRAVQGDILNPQKMEGTVGPLIAQYQDVDPIVIIRDTERTSPRELKSEATAVEQHLRKRFPGRKIVVVFAVHALESWIMADSAALRKVRLAFPVDKLPADPDSQTEPKRLLERLDPKYDYIRHNPRVADEADVREIERRSRSFRRLAVAARGGVV